MGHRKNPTDFREAINGLENWYSELCREWADEYDERIKKGEFNDREDFIERFDEETDSAQLVIYTSQAMACLLVSRNKDAYVEDFGEVPMQGRDSVHWEAMALMAFRRDIMEYMDSDVDDDETFEDDEDDEDED